MIEPNELVNSGKCLKAGKRYKAEISFLLFEDMDENVIYEVVAKAIANKAAGRTAWLGCTEQETKAN